MKKVFKRSTLAAAMLATSPAWAKSGNTGFGDSVGKSSLGVNQLSLETTPGYNATICATDTSAETKSGVNIIPNDLVLAVDPFAGSRIEVVFTVSDILAQTEDSVLMLVYSSKMSPPQLPTPNSKNPLELDIPNLEFLAMYNIPKQDYLVNNPTRLGIANPAPRSKISFSVNLDTSVLPTFMDSKANAYLQAALLNAEDYAAGKYENMILSEVETLSFAQYKCPEDAPHRMATDDNGNLVIENTSETTSAKIEVVTTSEKQATTKTK